MAFDLGELLKDVSDSDTGREQIEYIRLDQLDSDEKNFYALSEVPALADNIATVGLQQPLRVRRHPSSDGRYMIVSGHRRRAALELLAKDEPERWTEVACIVEQDAASPALQQLKLIFANSGSRKISDAELSEQAAQVEQLLYQLKEEGHEFPGRMRDHVAEIVQASKTKLARLKVIRDGLAKCWQPRFKKNELNESVAHALALLPVYWQQNIYTEIGDDGYLTADCIKTYMKRFAEIEKLKCNHRGRETTCQNMDAKRCCSVTVGTYSAFHCNKCCTACPALASCKYACPVFADKIKKLKADKRESRRQEKAAQEEVDRPQVEKINALWQRFGLAREMSFKEIDDCKKAMDIYFFPYDDDKVMALECGEAKISPTTKLPFGYSCYLPEISRLIALADLFGCSLDYLLCRTDVRELAQAAPESEKKNVSDSNTCWQTGTPPREGTYILLINFGRYSEKVVEEWQWDGAVWHDGAALFDPTVDGEILGWIPMPTEAADGN